jgi:hypothetical protein
MTRKSKYLLLGAVAVAALAIGLAIWVSIPPPLPPLLQGSLSGGGIHDACEHGGVDPSVVPELHKRLAEQFPPGTPTERLVRTLSEQGYHEVAPCARDPSIRRVAFCGNRGMFGGPGVHVWFKSDAADRIVWAGGYAFYICSGMPRFN